MRALYAIAIATQLAGCAAGQPGSTEDEDAHLSDTVTSVGTIDGTILYADNTAQVPKGLYRDFRELFFNEFYFDVRAEAFGMTVDKMTACFEPAWASLPNDFKSKHEAAARGERRFHISWSKLLEKALKDADAGGSC
jgi:hypothetical protein